MPVNNYRGRKKIKLSPHHVFLVIFCAWRYEEFQERSCLFPALDVHFRPLFTLYHNEIIELIYFIYISAGKLPKR